MPTQEEYKKICEDSNTEKRQKFIENINLEEFSPYIDILGNYVSLLQ